MQACYLRSLLIAKADVILACYVQMNDAPLPLSFAKGKEVWLSRAGLASSRSFSGMQFEVSKCKLKSQNGSGWRHASRVQTGSVRSYIELGCLACTGLNQNTVEACFQECRYTNRSQSHPSLSVQCLLGHACNDILLMPTRDTSKKEIVCPFVILITQVTQQ